tara:strand:+ start:406 stop:624 length:219 start_codon:yes stop_codon:yes gene_type:complete
MRKYSEEEKRLLRMVRLLNKHMDKISELDFGVIGDKETLNHLYDSMNDLNELSFLIKTDVEFQLSELTNKNT